MHFTVLVLGTQFGWEEVDDLLFPYWLYPGMISEEEMRADSRFVFEKINLKEQFEKERLMNLRHKELYENYSKNIEEWAEQQPFISYEKGIGWGYWSPPQVKDGKWDGYLIGGRWTGFFLQKERTIRLLGIPSIFTETPNDHRATDQARKCDIDWEAMRRRAREKGEQYWEEAIKAPEDEKLNYYNVHPDDTKKSYVELHEEWSCLTYAVLMDGEWYEMKYSSDPIEEERNKQEWRQEFKGLLDKISNNAVLTLVDCHC